MVIVNLSTELKRICANGQVYRSSVVKTNEL